MPFDVKELAQGVMQWHQSNRMQALQQQSAEELRQHRRDTLERLGKIQDTLANRQGVQPLQPLQPVVYMQTPQGLQLMQPMTDTSGNTQVMQPMEASQATVENTPKPEPVKEEKAENPYSSYAPDMDVSIGCVPCTRAHLSTLASSLRRAQEAGDAAGVATAREEMAALLEFDLTPEKLAATPEIDRAILAKYAQKIDELSSDLAGPVPEITRASASLKEAMRFARADGVEHPEVQIRMARTEDIVNMMERASFSPERLAKLPIDERSRVKAILPQLRQARQDLINNVHNADDLESVTVRLAEIDMQLNPMPDEQHVQDASARASQLNTDFRKDVISAYTKKGGTH